MKKLITLLAVTASFAVLIPSAVQAGDRHFSNHGNGHGSSHGSGHNSGHGSSSHYTPSHGSYGGRSGNRHYVPNRGHGSSHHSGSQGHISLPGFHLDFGSRGRH